MTTIQKYKLQSIFYLNPINIFEYTIRKIEKISKSEGIARVYSWLSSANVENYAKIKRNNYINTHSTPIKLPEGIE